MKLNDILKNENRTKSVGNSGFYGLYNTFERIKGLGSIKENQFEKYTNYFVKNIKQYTPKDLIYFVGSKIGEISSEREKKLLSEYNKAAWNNLAKKYGMEKFFDSGDPGYVSKLRNLFYNIGEKAYSGMDRLSGYLYDASSNFKRYLDEEGNNRVETYFSGLKDKTVNGVKSGINRIKDYLSED